MKTINELIEDIESKYIFKLDEKENVSFLASVICNEILEKERKSAIKDVKEFKRKMKYERNIIAKDGGLKVNECYEASIDYIMEKFCLTEEELK